MAGAIFDFNGTMIFDGELHDAAWNAFACAHRGRELTQEEFIERIYGRNIEDALAYIIGRRPEGDELAALEHERESGYRALCSAHADELRPLAPGLAGFLDALVDAGVRVNIATASPLANMEFFFELLPLGRWFSLDTIVYNDHSFAGKPEPDIFLRAAERIGIDAGECAVFEDAPSGLEAARRAHAASVIAVASEFDREMLAALPGVSLVIDDYRDADGLLERLFGRRG